MTKSQTKITISKKTKSQLKKLGRMGDTFDSVIVSLLDHSNKCDSFWSDRI